MILSLQFNKVISLHKTQDLSVSHEFSSYGCRAAGATIAVINIG